MTNGFAGYSYGSFGRLGPGARIAGYLIEELIGAGGMAVVFRARDEGLGRLAAVKVIAPSKADDEEFRARFLRESRAAAAVDSPYILPVYGAGEAEGLLYIATRLVPGGDLLKLLQESGGQLAPERVASLISQVASALDAAHAAGLVHRDVKPENILVDTVSDRPEHAYLADFGLSKGTDPADVNSAGVIRTPSGVILGTPDYCAPERIKGGLVDGRADQYALGCVAFVLLTGVLPFHREEKIATLFAHLQDPVLQATGLRQGLPPAVDDIIARVLAKSPADRYSRCGEFAAALQKSLATTRAEPSPRAPTLPAKLSRTQLPAAPPSLSADDGVQPALAGPTLSVAPDVAAVRRLNPRSAQVTQAGHHPASAAVMPSIGKVKSLLATGIALVAITVIVVASWQAHLFGGPANPQLRPPPGAGAGSQFRPLAWAAKEAVLPGDAAALTSSTAYNELDGISCPESGSCLAVGLLTPRAETGGLLVERSFGGEWAPDEAQPPLPDNAAPAGFSSLNDIVCRSRYACVAVGTYSTGVAANGDSTGGTGLVETLSGTTWIPASVPLPPDAGQYSVAALNGLACPVAGNCISVGTNSTPQDPQTLNYSSRALITTQDGGTWTSAEAPLPQDAATTGQAVLDSIACTAPRACIAVGFYTDKGGNTQGLIDTLANGTWTAAMAPVPRDAVQDPERTALNGVSCASGTCVAVGQYAVGGSGTPLRTLIETLQDGNAGSVRPQSPVQGILSAVYCASAASCLAVGSHETNSIESGLVVTLVNGKWTMTSVPPPANAATSNYLDLMGINCSTLASCEAVGVYTTRTGATVPLTAIGTTTTTS